jgi:hypothetical protein
VLKLVSVFLFVDDEVPSDANILSETLTVYERDNLPNIPKMALRALLSGHITIET